MKTIYDYHRLFGIETGAYYHAYDYACQVCKQSFELYENSKSDGERELNYALAKVVASKLNAPMPIKFDNK